MDLLTPPTLTRLDPRYPLLWRDESTVQFGMEGIVRVDVVGAWVEPLLQRLHDGIRIGSFDVVAHGVGAPRAAARQMLADLRPVLIEDTAPTPPVWVDTVNVADSRVPERMRQALADEHIVATDPAAPGAVAIVLVGGAAAALQLAGYLRDDVPHLPVAFERDAALIGPLVVPGRTPCLSCRDAHERDRDPAWPLLHAQLVGSSVEISSMRIAQAAGLVARILRTPTPAAGQMVRVSPDGQPAWRPVRHHAECPCLDPSFRSRPESATEPAPPGLPTATRSVPEFARLA